MIDFNRELTATQRQRIGRLLRYGHNSAEIAKRVEVSAAIVEAYKKQRWNPKSRSKGTGGKFPGDGKRRAEYGPLDRVVTIPDSELEDVESVVGVVLCTVDRKCLVDFPNGISWWSENQLLSAPLPGLILARCEIYQSNWEPDERRLVRQQRAAEVRVMEWRGMYVDTDL